MSKEGFGSSRNYIGVVEMIPLFQFVEFSLNEEREKLDENEDLRQALWLAIEKLTFYYDNLSPLVGVALLLDPRKKRSFLAEIGWSENWIQSAMLSLQNAFDFYKPSASTTDETISNETLDSYEMFKRRRRMQSKK